MALEFDAYHKWLAIPPSEQPPNFYRLLALNLFESDPDVIDSAANARMIHLRSLQTGPQAELTQKLLNEIAAARLCLLKPEKKSSYDINLRGQMARKIAAQPPPLPVSQANSPPVLPTLAVATESAPAALEFLSAAYQTSPSVRHTKAAWPRLLMILGPLIGIAAVTAAIVIRNARNTGDSKTPTDAGSAPTSTGNQLSATAAESRPVPRPIIQPSVAKIDLPSHAPPITSHGGDKIIVSGSPQTSHGTGSVPNRPIEVNPAVKPLLPLSVGKLRLQYRCMETKAETNQIRFQFQIVNDSDAPLNLADLKVRYWYALAADRTRKFWCDYAAINKDNVTGRFAAVVRPTDSAAGYLELAFADAAGQIEPSANSGEIQCRFAVDDWSNVDQSKDFSFDPTAAQWTNNSHVAVYRRGKLVWGQEPAR